VTVKRVVSRRIAANDIAGTAGSAPKSAYASPTLLTYGSVGGLTRGFSGTVADFFMIANPRMGMFSDRTLKENITRIGTHPLGFGLYLFDFRPGAGDCCGSGRQFGVMADEVEPLVPWAVFRGPDGLRMVDYALLGIKRFCTRIT